MRVSRWIDPTFAVELLLLALAAPALYFPGWFPAWAPYTALVVLVAGWIWRRWRLGVWYAPTPADWPIFFLYVVMLPVALWAAPGPLREEYSIPRAYILLWNLCLFWTFVTHASRSRRSMEWALGGFALSALGIALVAPLGMNWLYKFSGAEKMLAVIPAPLLNVFQGAESGFHPNQVAGTLLYALPLMLALSVNGLQRRPISPTLWLLLPASTLVFAVIVLTQSRSALLGLAVGLVYMALMPWRWGRVILVGLGASAVLLLPLLPSTWIDLLNDAPAVEALGGTSTLGFRQRVWTMALWGIADFPFTGMGLGAFRVVAPLLYNLDISPDYDIGHAHNIFLQTGLDFGLAGMVALIALYFVAVVQLASIGAAGWPGKAQMSTRAWAIGLSGSLVGQLVFSMFDAVALGAKTNFMFWMYFALVFALGNLAVQAADSA